MQVYYRNSRCALKWKLNDEKSDVDGAGNGIEGVGDAAIERKLQLYVKNEGNEAFSE